MYTHTMHSTLIHIKQKHDKCQFSLKSASKWALSVLFSVFILEYSSIAQNTTNKKDFPEISGQTLDKKTVVLPTAGKGKYTIIGMAYSKKAEGDLKTWINPAYNKFIAKTNMIDQFYDVNLYFIPMFTGINNLTADIALKQLSEGTNRQYYPYIVCYRGDLKKYKEELNMNEKDKPYFFVLNPEGKIIYQTSGEYSEKKMEEIDEKLTD